MALEVISQENLCSCSACRGIRLHVESKPGDDTTLHEEWEWAAFMVSTALNSNPASDALRFLPQTTCQARTASRANSLECVHLALPAVNEPPSWSAQPLWRGQKESRNVFGAWVSLPKEGWGPLDWGFIRHVLSAYFCFLLCLFVCHHNCCCSVTHLRPNRV